MDQQPKIPTLKDSQKPQVKVRGIGMGLTLAERLKQFKKKDLAFILAGLGVLFMAPLAEHFMMAPESADGTLQAGWGKGGSGSGSNIFGSGGSPYDRTDGLAPGSPMGGGSDLITPLNVRDPSSLIVGAGAAQQPPTNSAVPPTPPAGTHTDSDMKDALAAASARGIGAAAKKAALPVPKVALGGSGLRGLGVAGGGSSASASLGPISAGNVPNRAAGGDSTGNARSMKGYNGVARGQTGGGGGLDALKAAAGKAAENMNRGGGALSDLNAAANTAIPSGGSSSSGSGGPGGGHEDKGFGGNQDKNSKNTTESLAFLDMKARMEKDRELEYKKKELNDMGLLWGQMRNEGLKTFFTKGLVEPLAGVLADGVKGALTPAGSSVSGIWCTGGQYAGFTPDSEVSKFKLSLTSKGLVDEHGVPVGTGCAKGTKSGKDDTSKPSGKGQTVGETNDLSGRGGASEETFGQIRDLGDICTSVDALLATTEGSTTKTTWVGQGAVALGAMKTAARQLVTARDALYNGNSGDCSGVSGVADVARPAGSRSDDTVTTKIESAKKNAAGLGSLNSEGGNDTPAIDTIKNALKLDAAQEKVPGVDKVIAANNDLKQALELQSNVRVRLSEAEGTYKGVKLTDKDQQAVIEKLKTSLDGARAGMVTQNANSIDPVIAKLQSEVNNLGQIAGVGDKSTLRDLINGNVKVKELEVTAKSKQVTPVKVEGASAGATGEATIGAILKITEKGAQATQDLGVVPDKPVLAPESGYPDYQVKVENAAKSVGAAEGARDSAQATQGAWLDAIKARIPDTATLPRKVGAKTN